MPTPEAAERFTEWLTGHWPGGKHSAPHWQDGPWYIVMVKVGAAAPAVTELLNAHADDAIPVRGLDRWDCFEDASVFVASQFAVDILDTFDFRPLRLDVFDVAGPYDTHPGAPEILEVLPLFSGLTDEQDINDLATELATERPEEALAAVRALRSTAGSAAQAREWFHAVAEVSRTTSA